MKILILAREKGTRLRPLEIIEVQQGKYLGEDNIVRFDDKYKRDAIPLI